MSSGKRWKRPWVHDMLRFMSTDARVIARQYYATYGRNMCSDISALQANPQGVVLFTPFVVAMLKPIRTDEDLLWMDLAQSPPQSGWLVCSPALRRFIPCPALGIPSQTSALAYLPAWGTRHRVAPLPLEESVALTLPPCTIKHHTHRKGKYTPWDL